MFYRLTILYVVVLASSACSYVIVTLVVSPAAAALRFWRSISNFFAFSSSRPVNVPVHQVFAQQGKTAELACTDDSQQESINVAWMDNSSTVLTFNDERIIDDERFSADKLGNKWYLTIRQVKIIDNGIYQCSLSTNPIQHKYYNLTVFIPPEIDEGSSSPDVEATEGTSVRLFCNATGYPKPNVTWTYRRASEENNSSNVKAIQGYGPTIRIFNVSRHMDRIYTCTASNGFGNNVSQHIRVGVRYKPTVKIQQKQHIKYRGEKVNLTCDGQGYRVPKMHFAKDGLEIFDDPLDHLKYRYTKFTEGHNFRITLEIFDLDEDDFGYYKCVAINSLGKAVKFVLIKEARKVEKSTTTRSLPGGMKPTLPSDRHIKKTPTPEIKRNPEAKVLAGESKYKGGGTHAHPTLLLIVCMTGLVLRL